MIMWSGNNWLLRKRLTVILHLKPDNLKSYLKDTSLFTHTIKLIHIQTCRHTHSEVKTAALLLQDPPSQISLSTGRHCVCYRKVLMNDTVVQWMYRWCLCVCVFDAVLETLCLVFKSSNAQVKVESASSTCHVCGLVIYQPTRKANDPCKALDKNKNILVYISGSQMVVFTGLFW